MGVIGTNIYLIGAGNGGVTTEDLPAVLKDFYAQNGGTGKIVLKWAFNNTANLTGVYICYQAGEYPTSPYNGAKVVVDNNTTLSVDVDGLENGVEYFFRAYPYREIDGIKYFQTCNETCKTASTPNDIITPADLEVDGNYFVEVPKCTWADLGIGDSEETFPAFIVDGKEIDSFFVGKYCGNYVDNKAISKKGYTPPSVAYDKAQNYCKNIGTGWHEITQLEMKAIVLWCIKNNQIPAVSLLGTTGSDDISYSHNGKEDGIWELRTSTGTVTMGMRIYNRELQVISRNGSFANDAANADIDQTNTSKYWYAVDGTTGDLIIPDGKGTTENSIKVNGNKWDIVYDPKSFYIHWSTVTCTDSICEKSKNILIALGLLPPPTHLTTMGDAVIYGNSTQLGFYYAKSGSNKSLFSTIMTPNTVSGYLRPVFYMP